MKIDLFGATGFVGGNFAKLYPNITYAHPREDDLAIHKEVLYMISTVDNYNVFDDIYKDINTNLIKTNVNDILSYNLIPIFPARITFNRITFELWIG